MILSFFLAKYKEKIMKNLLATTALVSAIATSATAMDWSWENEITAEYMVDAEKTYEFLRIFQELYLTTHNT